MGGPGWDPACPSLRDPDRAPYLSIELEPHIADVNLMRLANSQWQVNGA